MIDPSELNLASLPWLPLKAKSALPRQPAIYFCLTPTNAVVYIGETSNLYNRWVKSSHDKKKQCQDCGCDRVAWLAPVPEIRFNRLPIERAFIQVHRPVLNMQVWNGLRSHNPSEFYNLVLPNLQAKEIKQAREAIEVSE